MATFDAVLRGALPAPFASRGGDSFDTSLWSATAIAPQRYEPLRGDAHTQVAIVGAGYTGLATAIALADAGIAATVLDAVEPGFGASGRNGGQVIPLVKYDPDQMIARYGQALAEGILQMLEASSDSVFALTERFDIACEATRAGWIQAAHNEAAVPGIRGRYEQWQARGANVAWLDAAQLAKTIGTDRYVGGWIHRGAGTVQPLSYARGLAQAAVSLGVAVHGASLVTRMTREADGWTLHTAQGRLRADQVVLAGNGYTTDLWPGLAQTIVPLYSMQIATGPLPAALNDEILPGMQCVSETRRVVRYFRKDRAGRFVIGSRGPFTPQPGAAAGQALVDSTRKLYPQLKDVPFEYRWAGRVAVTPDAMPHLHRLAPGVWAALGCNGRGVAMSTLMGRVLAAACTGDRSHAPQYPDSDLTRIPFHALHRLGVAAAVTWFRLLDRFA
ncbi:NAD(P)/FAD-dependent oxidoreductase [Paraburkholderia tropica]|uniref:NAD(P)/FAD-dependent oxidoreductase n=1 Tax=Paraburkholderia tropica TaxID=92647 RepID=UPI002AB5FC48|nr:FAD-binding oxidoreductase [Paraburkholderia tropica]